MRIRVSARAPYPGSIRSWVELHSALYKEVQNAVMHLCRLISKHRRIHHKCLVLPGMLVVKAHEEDDVLPIVSGRLAQPPDPTNLPKGPSMGGKTLGEELGKQH